MHLGGQLSLLDGGSDAPHLPYLRQALGGPLVDILTQNPALRQALLDYLSHEFELIRLSDRQNYREVWPMLVGLRKEDEPKAKRMIEAYESFAVLCKLYEIKDLLQIRRCDIWYPKLLRSPE